MQHVSSHNLRGPRLPVLLTDGNNLYGSCTCTRRKAAISACSTYAPSARPKCPEPRCTLSSTRPGPCCLARSRATHLAGPQWGTRASFTPHVARVGG